MLGSFVIIHRIIGDIWVMDGIINGNIAVPSDFNQSPWRTSIRSCSVCVAAPSGVGRVFFSFFGVCADGDRHWSICGDGSGDRLRQAVGRCAPRVGVVPGISVRLVGIGHVGVGGVGGIGNCCSI